MRQLALLHNFKDKRCLIFGGGKIASRRAKAVLNTGGKVDIIAIEIQNELEDLISREGGKIEQRAYRVGDVSFDYSIVIAATNCRQTNVSIAQEARDRNCLVNVVDNSSLCDIAFPSTIDRNPMMITVSSESTSPVLSRLLGQRIEALIPVGYGRLANLVKNFRTRVREKIPDTSSRAVFWENILQGVVAEKIFSGNQEEAEALLEQSLTNSKTEKFGEVYLIGAGPGDPDLLTLRAFRLLHQSEVVLYDRLVSPQIIEGLDGDKKLIYVGKSRSDHSVPQTDINQLLINYAKQGRRVARVKGGDPFIFGRGGEEIEQLAQEGIPFQVIPGITAANGCSCYAGIPLTHRDHSQSVRFVTGQLQDGTVNLNWPQLVTPGQTLVFYMGLNSLAIICKNLIMHGQSKEMPCALIEKGTTLDQKVYINTLGKIEETLIKEKISSPSLFIVGSVVTLHKDLAWF